MRDGHSQARSPRVPVPITTFTWTVASSGGGRSATAARPSERASGPERLGPQEARGEVAPPRPLIVLSEHVGALAPDAPTPVAEFPIRVLRRSVSVPLLFIASPFAWVDVSEKSKSVRAVSGASQTTQQPRRPSLSPPALDAELARLAARNRGPEDGRPR
jgi:hypothetical protein